MNDQPVTHATRDFTWVMRIFAFIYLVGACLFFFMPEAVLYLMNIGPRVLRLSLEIPMPVEHFWVTLSTSMMMMLFFTSLYSSIYPNVRGFVLIHMLSKVTSVSGFLYLFFTQDRYFAYALGALTDSMVIVVVLGFYLRSVSAGSNAPLVTGGGEEPASEPTGGTAPHS